MKSTTILAIATTIASVVTAEQLKYGQPIATTTWKAGSTATVSWTNTCAELAPSTTFPIVLQVQRPDGVQDPVAGLAPLGTLNCAAAGSTTVTIPATLPSGSVYSILVKNGADLSYSALFKIDNPSAPANATTPTGTTTVSGTATGTAATGTATTSGTATVSKPSVTVTTTASPKPTVTNAAGALKAGSAAALAVAGAVAAMIF
ncbi:hypothetical protein BGX23_007428 [Mortierella sp. AD031]|nr:hypothetical protein BGX23_007428 [Mortierella sp. AD031]